MSTVWIFYKLFFLETVKEVDYRPLLMTTGLQDFFGSQESIDLDSMMSFMCCGTECDRPEFGVKK